MMQKVMIVDDEESLRKLLRAIFETEGFEVIDASSGAECLRKLGSERPDIILMDMVMQGISGIETCEKIRQNPQTKDLKIIFVTVVRFSKTEKGALEKLNVLDYITKPFDNKELIRKVNKAIQSNTFGLNQLK